MKTGYSIFSTDFIDDNTGWLFAIESETFNVAVFQTTDKGEHWELKTSDNSLFNFIDNDFVNSTDGWACNGWIYHTPDAGKTWEVQYQPSPTPNELHALSMIDESTGWCVGDIGTILKTTDGNTWENNYTDFSDDLYDIFFINQQTGWITGENGLILKTVDGGENWLSQESNTTETLKNVVFCDEDTGWATGSSIILHTTDGGETWLEQNTISSGNIIKIALADAQKAWLITYSPAKIYYTSDGGNTWTEYNGNFDTGYGYLAVRKEISSYFPAVDVSAQMDMARYLGVPQLFFTVGGYAGLVPAGDVNIGYKGEEKEAFAGLYLSLYGGIMRKRYFGRFAFFVEPRYEYQNFGFWGKFEGGAGDSRAW